MKEILFNLALIDLNNYCQSKDIDISGTHLVKFQRSQQYGLIRNNDGVTLATVTFYKNQVPRHTLSPQIATKQADTYIEQGKIAWDKQFIS